MTTHPQVSSVDREHHERAFPISRLGVFLSVVLFFAALNACSFFLRTSYPWQRLIGRTRGILLESYDLEIGFPLNVVFRPGLGLVDGEQWVAFVGNVLCAIVVAAFYATNLGSRSKLSRSASEVDKVSSNRWQWQLRFRLIHMLTITTVTAVLLGLFARAPEPSLRALTLIYLAGPCALVWAFYALRYWPKSRSFVLLTVVALLAGAAAKFAVEVFGDFTFGLFGVFVCWLPQLLAIIVVVFVSQNLKSSWQMLEGPK